MVAISLAFPLAVVLLISARPVWGGQIHWQECTDIDTKSSTVPVLCGNLSVPLDYTDPKSAEKLTIQLVKTSATQSPSNRSILFNFGGPGEPNRQTFAQFAAILVGLTGGSFDLISFDTRGAINTIPFICWPDETARLLASAGLPASIRASDTAIGYQWAAAQIIAAQCYSANNKTGSLVGTAFVARDMVQIVDALGEDGLLRYWGLSYGTVLGATFSAMFPDKVDRVLLDGVTNVFEYYDSYPVESSTDVDSVFAGFASSCIAAPQYCALAGNNITAAELTTVLYGMLEDLKQNPLPSAYGVLDYSTIKLYIFNQLYDPLTWPSLARSIAGILTRNETTIGQIVAVSLAGHKTLAGEYTIGIRCSDSRARATQLGELMPSINKMLQKGYFVDLAPYLAMTCSQWKFKAKEIYSGNFQVKTRKPIMLIGNTHDPVTPLVSARNLSTALDGSVVLENNIYGHTSMYQPSSCTRGYILSYFRNGTLPAAGTICQPSQPPFYPISFT